MKRDRIIDLFEKFKKLKIAVIGDFVLDKYLMIDTKLNEPSLETGLTAFQVVRTRQYPGACGTITNNLTDLGVGAIYAVTFIGKDGTGYELKKELISRKIKLDYMTETEDMITPSYVKPMMLEDGREIESNRLDIKNFKNTPVHLEKKILSCLDEVFDKMDAIIILDQMVESNCGVITDNVREKLIQLSKTYKGKIIFADSRSKIDKFTNMSIKCNNYEACKAIYPECGEKPDENLVIECGTKIFDKNKKPVFITNGKNGIITFGDKGWKRVPTADVPKPYDICGAGDSVTAAAVSCLASGADEAEAAFIANMAASVTIRKLGVTGTATLVEVLDTYENYFKEITY